MEKNIEKLLDAIVDVVTNLPGKTWQEKRDAVLAQASQGEKSSLEEFVSWFEEIGEEDFHK